MKALRTFATVAALSAGLAAAATADAAIFIGVSVNGGAVAPAATVATGPDSLAFAGVAGGYSFLGSASAGMLPDLLFSNLIATRTRSEGVASLDIFVTETDLTQSSGLFDSGLTANQSARPLPVTLTSYIDPLNGLYGGQTLGGPVTFSSATPQTLGVNSVVAVNGPYSVTARYHVQGGAPGVSENASIDIAEAAPEPASWALMILGFGGLGAVLRRRSQGALA